jgi:Asp-tRNA(Asn)/Glu-tRNA(Gln) amidotransferase A subunit family amidase/fructose-1,6-bisphosphatase/inositol monophosphatase family enzyme
MASTTATQGRELAFAGVARQAEMVRAGEVSPRELVETTLGRIEALDPKLNAFRVVFAERALVEADQAAGRAGAGDGRPLLGVPIAVKDDQALAGEVRVRGSNACSSPEPEDADLVRRLRAAGAIVVGITRTPELTLWPFTETAAGGITRNPWDPQRTPGGSSGGSGAAVAAGLVAGATGSDGAGSIRIPAACCGLFGLKTQRGLISTAPLDEVCTGLSVYGFLTRNVADAALLYEVVTGKPYIAAAQQEPPKLRIALSLKIPPGSSARLHPDWRRAAEDTAELLRSLGHDVAEANPAIGAVGTRVVARPGAHPHRGAGRRQEGQRDLRGLRRRAEPDAREGAAAGRQVRRSWRDVHPQRGPALDAVQRAVEPRRQPGRRSARRVRFQRAAAFGPACRPPGIRADPLLAGRPDRGRPSVGRPAPADLLSTRASAEALAVIAAQAAQAAGELLRDRFVAGGERATGSKSTPTDLVSEADLAAERAIRAIISAQRPGDAILGEEGGETQEGSGLRWIVDPLDGTVNFLFGVPQWCVSVAVHDDEGGLAGVVFDPLRDEVFAAQRGGPVTLNGAPVTASERTELETALVATGFAYDAGVRAAQAQVIAGLLPRVRDVRRMGSAALDLAWTAAGRYDAFYERGVQIWDTAAGTILCQCAGLEVRALDADGALPSGVVVAPPGLIDALSTLVV